MCPLPILAFSILNLPMLGWLGAAAVPILIHLWSRRKYREMSWAAMEYLLAALRRRSRRMQFEQWLLLAIRTLIIVFLVLAVAEPVLEQTGFAFAPGVRTHRVLVIDGSFSMAYAPGDESLFQRARQIARQIVEESPQGDAFTLVLMSAPPRVVVGNPVFDPGDFLEEIDALELPHGTLDLAATLAAVENVLQSARRESPRLAREEVYFLTDLQRVGWLPESSAATTARMRELAGRLAEAAALVVIDLGQDAAENSAISGLRTRTLQPLATVGRNVHVEVDLRSFARQPLKDRELQLWVDGRQVAKDRVELAAGGEAATGFSCRFDVPGDHVVEVRLQGDQLPIDDRRYAVVPVKEVLNVLCVNGRPSGDPREQATYHLVPALSPWGEGEAWIRPEVVTESALMERDLTGYDCIFLCDVAQFTAGEARLLDAYLTAGGSLVFFLGDQVLAERYNRELAGQRPGAVHLLPAELAAVETVDAFRLDPLDYRHPIAAEFRDHEGAGLLNTPVSKYFKLTLSKQSPARVAVALANGDPLIVEQPVRRGRVVLVATSADLSWTLMPKWHSFPAIVQEILAFAVAGQRARRNVEVGQPLGGSVPTPAAEVALSVDRPDGRTEQLRLETEGDSSTWQFADTTASGVYTVRFAAPLDRSERFAVNVNTAESDLQHLQPEQLRDDVWPGIAFFHQTTWQNLDRRPSGPIRGGGRLHLGLLYGVLGLLFLETYLAWRFGHHTK